jgi:hypothetical protein
MLDAEAVGGLAVLGHAQVGAAHFIAVWEITSFIQEYLAVMLGAVAGAAVALLVVPVMRVLRVLRVLL